MISAADNSLAGETLLVERQLGSDSDRLRLELRFPPLARDLHGVAVHVIVEDVGEADAPASRLGGADFTGRVIRRDDGRLSLELPLPDLTGADVPAVRVHVDRTGSGRITVGDFVNPSRVELFADRTAPLRIDLVEVR
jgi:hypothetical protein